jgi:ABC-type lipoprotein export system ATPase subunit
MIAGNTNLNTENLPLNPEFAKNDFCYTIEGNIGCGKSTFLEILRQKIPEAKWIE